MTVAMAELAGARLAQVVAGTSCLTRDVDTFSSRPDFLPLRRCYGGRRRRRVQPSSKPATKVDSVPGFCLAIIPNRAVSEVEEFALPDEHPRS